MSSRDWPNSSPLPPSPRQILFPAESSRPVGRVYDNHGLSLYDNHYSAYAPGPVYNPYAVAAPDPRFRTPFNVSNLGNMNSRALVAAALSPALAPAQEELQFQGQTPPGLSSKMPQPIHRPQIEVGASSPLSEPVEEDFASDIEHNTQAVPAQKSDSQSKKRKHSEVSDADEEYVEDTQETVVDVSAAKTRKSRAVKGRRTLQQQVSSDEEDVVLPTPPKKLVRKTKLPTKRLVRKKPQGKKVPETLQDAGEADKMMWFWKNSGRDWEDIRVEWARLTGVKPGKSSLSVRYIKLNENFARNGAAGDVELIKYRREAEEELLVGLWDKVAEKMLAYNPLSEHNPKDLKKRYDLIVRSGFDIEKLLADDAAEKQEEEEEEEAAAAAAAAAEKGDKEEMFPHAVDKVESRFDPALLLPVANKSAFAIPAFSADHDLPILRSNTASSEATLSRVLTEFNDSTAKDLDTRAHPACLAEIMPVAPLIKNAGNPQELSSLELLAEDDMIPTSPAIPSVLTSSSFRTSLVTYDSDSE